MNIAKKKSTRRTSRSRLTRKRKEDIGLSPSAVVFRGQQKVERTVLRVMEFDATQVVERELASVGELQLTDGRACRWIAVNGIHDTATMQALAERLGIPSRIMSDILNPSIRPKYEVFGSGLFITLKLLQYNEKSDQMTVENLSLVVFPSAIITFREELDPVFDPVRNRIRGPVTKIRSSGTDYIAFTLLDIVVDNYIYLLGMMGDKIETLDDRLTAEPGKDLLTEINAYKQEINFIRKCILPAKDMIVSLNKLESEFLSAANKVHYQELHFNINDAVELTDSYREILYDQISVYHTIVSSRQNDILRTLTLFSVIFIPLTFIVGVYGTNFDYLPELRWKYGYFAMWGGMVSIGLVMWLYFRRKKWW
jgi:magnesium transporter